MADSGAREVMSGDETEPYRHFDTRAGSTRNIYRPQYGRRRWKRARLSTWRS
jgi:hypothetical protein